MWQCGSPSDQQGFIKRGLLLWIRWTDAWVEPRKYKNKRHREPLALSSQTNKHFVLFVRIIERSLHQDARPREKKITELRVTAKFKV